MFFEVPNKWISSLEIDLSHVCSGGFLRRLKDSATLCVYKACVFRAYFYLGGRGSHRFQIKGQNQPKHFKKD